MRPMDHIQARELMPGYVLGALEVSEQQDLLQHVKSCPSCYELVQEAMEVGEKLASTITETEPPDTLRSGIRDSLTGMCDQDDSGEEVV